MVQHVVKLTHKIVDKEGLFFCENDTPIPVAREMLCQFLKELGVIEDQVLAQQKALAEQKAAEEKGSGNEKTESQSTAA